MPVLCLGVAGDDLDEAEGAEIAVAAAHDELDVLEEVLLEDFLRWKRNAELTLSRNVQTLSQNL